MKWISSVAIMIVLAACSSTPPGPLPTVAQLPISEGIATPTTENQPGSAPTPESAGAPAVDIQLSGAVAGEFTQALLTFEIGGGYTLLFEQVDTDTPIQLRLILAGNIEPGTYDIVPAADFQLPQGQSVAARFDLGFLPETIEGTFVLESIGEDNFTGSLDLTAQSAEGIVEVEGRFENLGVLILNG